MTASVGLWWLAGMVVVMFGFAVGFAARGNDNRRYYANRERYRAAQVEPPPQLVHAVTERAEALVVVHVHLPGLPQPAPVVGWPRVVDGQVIRELPPVGLGN